MYLNSFYIVRVVGATNLDDKLIGFKAFNNLSDMVAPTTLYIVYKTT